MGGEIAILGLLIDFSRDSANDDSGQPMSVNVLECVAKCENLNVSVSPPVSRGV